VLVLCVKKGCLHVEYRGTSSRLTAGDAILIDCREPHYYYADMDGLEFYYLHFEGSNAHEICQHILNLRGAVVEKQNAAALTAFIEKTMQFYEEGKTETEFEESLRVYEILRYLHGGSAQDAGRASYIDQVTAYINENIERRITLEELAETVSLSSFHFSRRFKRDTGYSPVEYVNHKKLDYAKTLLIRTEWPVTEIAERTGFSLKGFIKLFSQAEGMPPLAWRRSRQMDMNKPELLK
jgi:AraC-like DNA-binding protein